MEAMHSPVLGYLRFPTFAKNQLYFVAEDNLWEVALEGGRAIRPNMPVGPTTRQSGLPDVRQPSSPKASVN